MAQRGGEDSLQDSALFTKRQAFIFLIFFFFFQEFPSASHTYLPPILVFFFNFFFFPLLSVEYACGNRYHDYGLCGPCFESKSKVFRGPPGDKASTNIYDAILDNVNYDGVMYLTGLVSRKPPKIAISWKHTRRLVSPNLVGVVSLKSRGSGLELGDRVYWAEIVNHRNWQGGREEFKERENGKLAVSLIDFGLEKNDAVFQKGTKYLNHLRYVIDTLVSNLLILILILLCISCVSTGGFVAIIDCQTFVPEYVPVLKALELQRQSRLPFKNGQLLNIGMGNGSQFDEPPIEAGEPLLELELDSEYAVDEHDLFHLSNPEIRQKITDMVEISELEPIVQIRRNHAVKKTLCNRLSVLIEKATLDQGQMKAFMQSMTNPVHCTQGVSLAYILLL
jgi:hypothetical protein